MSGGRKNLKIYFNTDIIERLPADFKEFSTPDSTYPNFSYFHVGKWQYTRTGLEPDFSNGSVNQIKDFICSYVENVKDIKMDYSYEKVFFRGREDIKIKCPIPKPLSSSSL